jgi:hypothetical protein
MIRPSLNGYGYKWRDSAACCNAAAIEAGDVSECPSSCWFWLLAIGAIGVALLAPKRGRA